MSLLYELQRAIDIDDIVAIVSVLKIDPDCHDHGELNRAEPLLQTAIRHGNVSLVKFILSRGVDPNERWSKQAPLHTAVSVGNIQIVELLLETKADPNVRSYNNRTPLHTAALKGRTEIAKLLIKHSADPNVRCKYGWTPLHCAVSSSNENIVTILLACSANPNATKDDGETPLSIAIEDSEKLGIVKSLVEHGGSIDLAGNEHCAAEKFHARDLFKDQQELLDIVRNSGGKFDHESDIVSMQRHLLISGISANLYDEQHTSLLNLAIMERHAQSARLLLKHGADPDEGTPSPLCRAIFGKDIPMIKTLLMYNVNVDFSNNRQALEVISKVKAIRDLLAAYRGTTFP